MATLQLPEGYTVRKVKGVLKVVPMRRKVVVAKEKIMFPAIQHSSGWGWQLMYVRRPSEEKLKQYAEWYRPYCLFGISDTPVHKLSSTLVQLHQRHPEIVGRRCDGSTPSNENSIWIISQKEFDMLLAEDKSLVEKKQEAARHAPVAVPEEVKQLAAKYGSSSKAWDKEDERAWALMHQHGL